MKHAVSVAELLELHRLGELYLKWASTPFAVSETDLQELQELSDLYHINHSSALFSFQRQYQREMVGGIEQTIDDAIEAIPGLAEALKMVPTTPLVREDVRSPAAKWADLRSRRQCGEAIDLDEAWGYAVILGHDLQSFYQHHISGGVRRLWPGEATWFERKARELGVQMFHMDVQHILVDATWQGKIPVAAERADRLAEFGHERNEALAEAIHEDNEMDRQDHREAAFERATELRKFREQLDGEMTDEREIEILRDLSNVDELTNSESARLEELVERAQLSQDTVIAPRPSSVPIPSGVVQDAITTGHIQKIK